MTIILILTMNTAESTSSTSNAAGTRLFCKCSGKKPPPEGGDGILMEPTENTKLYITYWAIELVRGVGDEVTGQLKRVHINRDDIGIFDNGPAQREVSQGLSNAISVSNFNH